MSNRILACRLAGLEKSESYHRAGPAIAEALESRVLMAGQPIINEFLASNKTTNTDEDGDSSDWIEIYNPNSSAISLNGYYLTDKQTDLTEWKFPDVSLAGKGYLIV